MSPWRGMWATTLRMLAVASTVALSFSEKTDSQNYDEVRPVEHVLSHESPNMTTPSPRNATIRLYPGSYNPYKKPTTSCSAGSPFETVSLAAGTCLSGDYYLDRSVAILDAPVCADGSPPYFALFKRRGCTGSKVWYDIGREGLPTCLDTHKWPLGARDSPKKSWSHWSMIFYCSHLEAASRADGADEHREARPPQLTPGAWDSRPGRVHVFTSEAACEARRPVARDEELEAPIYFNLPAYIPRGSGFIRVVEPSFCADGTRARLALHEDVSCEAHGHGGHNHDEPHDHNHGAKLLDITDEEGDRCIDVKEYTAISFTCSGSAQLPSAKSLGATSQNYGIWWALGILLILMSCLVVMVMTKGVDVTMRMPVCVSFPIKTRLRFLDVVSLANRYIVIHIASAWS